jgi:ATP-dependent Zn protease
MVDYDLPWPRVAYHEAGHVVSAFADGLALRVARLKPEPECLFNKPLDRSCPTREAIERHVHFYFSGYLAERRYAPREVQLRNSAPDLANARKLIALLVGQDGQDFVAHYQRLCYEAQILIMQRWHEIDAVATALLEREALSAMELHAIIVRSR